MSLRSWHVFTLGRASAFSAHARYAVQPLMTFIALTAPRIYRSTRPSSCKKKTVLKRYTSYVEGVSTTNLYAALREGNWYATIIRSTSYMLGYGILRRSVLSSNRSSFTVFYSGRVLNKYLGSVAKRLIAACVCAL